MCKCIFYAKLQLLFQKTVSDIKIAGIHPCHMLKTIENLSADASPPSLIASLGDVTVFALNDP